jgi:putative radical SAM enzyme (TIGR03279 family)
VVGVTAGSPAERAGVVVGDEVLALCGEPVQDVIQYRMLADEADPWLELRRGGLQIDVEVAKRAGEPLGIEVDAAVFDRVRTCDNHCEFCFIYQLPPGLRRSLYLKDDDYRLSFLFGNFTTLTRFTEADLERVLTEGLSPLYVSIHATDPAVRADLLHNRRGATSLRWLRQLLDHGVVVHGQIVVCPGLNDAAVLEDTLCGVLDEYPELATLAVVPLGLSRFNTAPRMRLHTSAEAAAVVDLVSAWQETFLDLLGHRLVFAADEYYLMAGRPFPELASYEGMLLHEDGVGMARAFEAAFRGETTDVRRPEAGFFAWSDAAPAPSRITATVAGYRAPRTSAATASPQPVQLSPRRGAPVAVLTGTFGAAVLGGLLEELRACAGTDVRLVPVDNRFFGGNVGVTGLMVGEDLQRVLATQPVGHRYLLPDVCLSEGRFLDGTTPAELGRPVEIVPTDGASLRRALEHR